MTLYNNFLLKRGVGLFSRVGLISGDYGNTVVTIHCMRMRTQSRAQKTEKMRSRAVKQRLRPTKRPLRGVHPLSLKIAL